ncbi:MAG: site-2 protease family protein [Oscillospiraceae bacterium]|nr:site-2 protease family protein [Oscillospiraceae bacterium]
MPIVFAIIALCIIILIHELGHFGAARLFKMKVYQFNLGMGPILLKKRIGETQYALRLLPIGGSCMLGEDDEGSDDPHEFKNKPVWQRIIVIAAGAFLNLILGLILAIVLNIVNPINSLTIDSFVNIAVSNTGSTPLMEGDEIVRINGMRVISNPEIGYVMDNSLMRDGDGGDYAMTVSLFGANAFTNYGEYGLQRGDRILSVNGYSVNTTTELFTKLREVVKNSQEENTREIILGYDEDGEPQMQEFSYITTEIDVRRYGLPPMTLSEVQLRFRTNEDGERILVEDFFVQAVYEFVVNRNGERVTLSNVIFPAVPNERGGISYRRDFHMREVDATLGNLLNYSTRNAIGMGRIIWLSLIDMFRGTYGLNDLSGPVGIFGAVGEAATFTTSFGEMIIMIVQISAFITINLGIVNLLPIPALDGARLVFLGVEAVRRKPLNQNVESTIHFVGFALLMILILVVTFNDVRRLITG